VDSTTELRRIMLMNKIKTALMNETPNEYGVAGHAAHWPPAGGRSRVLPSGWLPARGLLEHFLIGLSG